GLDRPLWQQYLTFLRQAATGDLGVSLYLKRSVTGLIMERLPATLHLALTAAGLGICMALPLGLVAGVRRGTWMDRAVSLLTMLGQALPSFWVGLMFVFLFSRTLRWLPAFGRDTALSIVLPAVTLALAFTGLLTRLVRSGTIQTMTQDYIRTARSKGLTEPRVVMGHALKNLMIPVVTLMGLQIGNLLAGAIVVETVFAWPGLGLLVADSISYRDYTLVQGVTIVIAAVFNLINLGVDLCYAYLDPTIRLS
ncbi:MAG: ABC transporter permease, partial [Armatimonadetes bacterium]|nr:ABC transporter permease [Armatimonadota bacterium]